MAERSMDPEADPFGPRSGWVASLAGHLHVTEGQLYSLVIGLLVVWVVSANALPEVVWDRSPAAGVGQRSHSPVAAPSGLLATGTEERPPSPGLLTAPPPELPLAPLDLGGAFSGERRERAPGQDPPSPPTPLPGPPAGSLDDASAGPVRVTGAGYASASAGTPLATIGVPPGSVAVARRAGRPHNVAYLRLAGRDGPLELAVDTDGANMVDALAELRLCLVAASQWHVGHGDVELGEAPPVDCDNPIEGARAESGDRWSFDVSGLELGQISGVAIMPSEDAVAPQFQVVFRIVDGNGGERSEVAVADLAFHSSWPCWRNDGAAVAGQM